MAEAVPCQSVHPDEHGGRRDAGGTSHNGWLIPARKIPRQLSNLSHSALDSRQNRFVSRCMATGATRAPSTESKASPSLNANGAERSAPFLFVEGSLSCRVRRVRDGYACANSRQIG